MKRDSHERSQKMHRRYFLTQVGALAAGLSASPAVCMSAGSTLNKLVIGVMGLSRGLDHIKACLSLPGVEIAYICDVDDRRIQRAFKTLGGHPTDPLRKARGVRDFRTILDDKRVDALSVAAPNHWHAPATILACQAGKHVYVEKPGSHNILEGKWMVAAARKYRRVVQMGNQRRSWPSVIEAIAKLRSGTIGTVRSARAWYNKRRGSIGVGRQVAVPSELDYSLWQGPAPERPYLDNLVHYNWHWRWHWGGGELANNGIHRLDVVRWGLGVDCPRRVTCGGGRYHFKDDQETPDTALATFDFGDKVAFWDCSSCQPRLGEHLSFVTFYGDGGLLRLATDGAYQILDMKGMVVEKGSSSGDDACHFADFFDSVRTGKQPSADIEEGQKGTLLCHLGNIAFRTGRTLTLDPKTQTILADPEATALQGREYRHGWESRLRTEK